MMTSRPVALLTLIFCGSVGTPALACVQPGTITQGYSWAPGATVSVGILSFGSKTADVQNSLNNWNASLRNVCVPPSFNSSISSSAYSISFKYGPIANQPNGQTVRGATNYTSFDINGRLSGASSTINNAITADATITSVVTHEIGHTFALTDCNLCGLNSTIMEVGDTVSSINTQISPVSPTVCDMTAVSTYFPCGGGGGGGGCTLQQCGSASYCPNSPCGNGGQQICCVDSGGPHPCCTNGSPIIIDAADEGFHLTGVTEGVKFPNKIGDMPGNISWTDPRFHNAWLALDRNGNGSIDALSELFGNYTPQPPSDDQNGYRALAVFDDPRNGGNGDGILDPEDAVYSSLRLWVDKNHDGISQPGELFTLPEAGVFSVNLSYHEEKKKDRYGNEFRYRSSIVDRKNASREACYDVFLLEEMPLP